MQSITNISSKKNRIPYGIHHVLQRFLLVPSTHFHKLMWYPQTNEHSKVEVGRLLSQYGADLSIEDHQGWTAYTIGTADVPQTTAHEYLLRQGCGTDFDPTR